MDDNASKQPTLTQNGFLGFLHGNEQDTKHESSESTVKTIVKIYEKKKRKKKVQSSLLQKCGLNHKKVGGFPSITVIIKQQNLTTLS